MANLNLVRMSTQRGSLFAPVLSKAHEDVTLPTAAQRGTTSPTSPARSPSAAADSAMSQRFWGPEGVVAGQAAQIEQFLQERIQSQADRNQWQQQMSGR
jgi:hypothetical protein